MKIQILILGVVSALLFGCSTAKFDKGNRKFASVENQEFACKVEFQEWGNGGLSTFYTESIQRVPVVNGTAQLTYSGAFSKVEAELYPNGYAASCTPIAGIEQTDGSQSGRTADGIIFIRFNVSDTKGLFKTNKLGSIKLSCHITNQ